jgi:hypothetical protein
MTLFSWDFARSPHRPPGCGTLSDTLARVHDALRDGLETPPPHLTPLALHAAAYAEFGLPLRLTLVGPTGSGKTMLARRLAEALALPYLVAPVTDLVETGWQGTQLSDLLGQLHPEAYQAALTRSPHDDLFSDESLPVVRERGVLILDEIDKLAVPRGLATRDTAAGAWRIGRQQSLLPLLDPLSHVLVAPRTTNSQTTVQWSLGQTLVISCGAFSELVPEVDVTPRDLVAAGLLPELVDRLGVPLTFPRLALPALVRALTARHPMLEHIAARLTLAPSHAAVQLDAATVDGYVGPRGLTQLAWHTGILQLSAALREESE